MFSENVLRINPQRWIYRIREIMGKKAWGMDRPPFSVLPIVAQIGFACKFLGDFFGGGREVAFGFTPIPKSNHKPKKYL